MGLAKCPNGHIYNPRRYGKICPYCNMKTQDEAFAENRWDLSLPWKYWRRQCVLCAAGSSALRVQR